MAYTTAWPPGRTQYRNFKTFMSSSSKESLDSFKFVSSSSSASLKEENIIRRRLGKEDEVSVVEEDDLKLSEAKKELQDKKAVEEIPDEGFPIHHASIFIVMVSIIFRLLVSLHSYSGAGKAPLFGDFEAQRHWMEITVNVPMKDWYRNTGANDLKYWGLDYPPLSAYWAYITGLAAQKINPDWIALIKSRGFESDDLKTFMRMTAIFSDVLIMISGSFTLASKIPNFPKANLLLALMTPGFLLIDHGHFQYNNVMLGFTLWSLAMFASRKYSLSVAFLMLSVAFKQMNIYSIPAFGAALLGIGMYSGSFGATLLCYLKWGLSAVITLSACFAPFLESKELILTVLRRLFPVNRGLFEEKVANFWCTLSILTKFHRKHSNEQLFKYCLTSVVISLSPMVFGLIYRGAKNKIGITRFLYALSYGCLSMYLFSYHVHEKQILIPLLPIAFLSSEDPGFVYFFTLWSSFSLFPLMRKDNLQIAYFSIMMAWQCFFYLTNSAKISKIPGLWKLLIVASLDFIVLHHIGQVLWTPPAKLPDLFLVLNTLASSGAFGISAIYLLYKFMK